MEAETEFYQILDEIIQNKKLDESLCLFPEMIANYKKASEYESRNDLNVFMDMVQKKRQESIATVKPIAAAKNNNFTMTLLEIIQTIWIFLIGMIVGILVF